MSHFNHPDGLNKLIPTIIDELATSRPEKIYAEIPKLAESYAEGYRNVTYREFANAINGTARWIVDTLGKNKDFETLVYFGPHDIRYTILLVAAVKAGYKMLYPSDRFATIGIVELIKKINGKAILVPLVPPAIVTQVVASYSLDTYQVPEVEELLTTEYSIFPYTKEFKSARSEPLVVLHTSGSTGFPKPIIWTHDYFNSFGAQLYLEAPAGYESLTGLMLGTKILSMFPRFHAAHIYASLVLPIYTGTVIVHPIAGHPPIAQVAIEAARLTRPDVAALIPPIVEQLGSDPALLDAIVPMVKAITFGGGGVTKTSAEPVSEKIRLFSSMGSTEMTLLHIICKKGAKTDQWRWLNYHPSVNVSMEHREGNLYELVIKRDPPIFDTDPPVFKIYTDRREYASGDLYTPHPTDPELWAYYGRLDDMIVFGNGEKFYPVDIENFLMAQKEIDDALFIGTGRLQGALLLKLAEGTDLGEIWDIIEEMNRRCIQIARVDREHVLLVDPKKPLTRSGKGTIQRRTCEKLYQEELNSLYGEYTLSQ